MVRVMFMQWQRESVRSLRVINCFRSKLCFQPTGDIPKRIQAPQFVEYLVAGVFVKNNFDIFYTCASV